MNRESGLAGHGDRFEQLPLGDAAGGEIVSVKMPSIRRVRQRPEADGQFSFQGATKVVPFTIIEHQATRHSPGLQFDRGGVVFGYGNGRQRVFSRMQDQEWRTKFGLDECLAVQSDNRIRKGRIRTGQLRARAPKKIKFICRAGHKDQRFDNVIGLERV